MPLDKRKLFLSCAVALTTLASVAAIVPLGSQPDANRRNVSAEPAPQPPPASLSNDATDEARPAEVVPTRTETDALAPALFEGAAQQNRALKDNLSWTFGGKTQRGWAIYVPLIQRAVGTEDDPASERFAASLARWQKNVGLKASGVLDEATLMRMVSTWQSQRMKSRVYPQPDQLLTVPRAEFYDSGRADDLRQIERQTYAAYKRMLAAAAADSSLQLKAQGGELAASEKYLKIISAFRSREYQDRLRKLEPNAGRAALAVNSPHFTGRALDIYVGGEPTITKDSNRALQTETRAYRWLVKNASRFGFCPYFYEPWHWEYCAP
ncbi:MAG TPA: D-alanyl-D-alanine carboxypeptidase family protein [Pyrinomonadaceae bacterium]|jgi:LAS superfamily LD-carboxypeptidase LdcB|nr:D-alanyl-D-alanine carboxypeptidase family protein [Pyrinomonadaceae bacterium]